MNRTTRGDDERKDEDERMTAGQPTANRPAPATGTGTTRDQGPPPAPDDEVDNEPQGSR